MFPHDEFKLTRQAVFALLVSAAFSQTVVAAPVGTVVFAVGDVSAASADGQVRRLLKGTEVTVGDTIVTGADGRAQVRFTDGAFSSFQPETRFRVDQYQYAGKTDGSEKGFFSLLKGALRTVTGAIGHVNKKSYQVTTPTASIGIRGTEYLAREGNSLNVSVGEGQIEVCNAAGCLIVADGESAFVKDTSTQPTFTQQKTDAGPPPPPPPPKPDDFKVAENRDASGGPTVIPPPPAVTPLPDTPLPDTPPPDTPPPDTTPPPTLLSGAGYLGALAGHYTDEGTNPFVMHSIFSLPADATFNAAGELLTYSAAFCTGCGNFSASAGVIAGGFTDGVIGWGRWDGGNATDSTGSIDYSGATFPLKDVHYVVGQPAPAADMVALNSANVVGSYSLLGFTFPTAIDSDGVRTVGTQPVTGSLKAWFGAGQLDVTLGVPIGGNQFGITGNAYFYPTSGSSGLNPAAFYGLGSVSGASGNAAISGLFAGANASRAGLVYQFDTDGAANPIGIVSGAAAFQKTSTTTGLPPVLSSGSGYLGAMAGHYINDGTTHFIMPGSNEQLPGDATFNAAGALLSYSADICTDGCSYTENFSASADVIASGFTDGVIGWGRWDSGTGGATPDCNFFGCEGSSPLKDVHYVIGQPTPSADMVALNSSNTVGSYSLIGFTFPTAIDSSGVRTVGTQPVTGSLTARFGTGLLDVTLGVPIGGNRYGITGNATFDPTSSDNPASFHGSGLSVSGPSDTSATISGMFVGANASRAGLVYQIPNTNIGTVNGAAAFKQTSTTTGPID